MRRCFRRARALPAAGACFAAILAAGACVRGPAPFDETRARRHIDVLAGDIGSRPVGSAAARRAREYVTAELERAGFSVRVQHAESTDEGRALTVPVANIIAVRDGASDGAIALAAHYDSVPDAAGALDDALGVAVCLEAARVLAADGLRSSLMIIITDAEEIGLMGARAAVQDAEVARRVRALLNFDGTGAAGPSLLFETAAGRDGASLLGAWARGAPAPAGGSFAIEIYRRLPRDTDFTMFRRLGVPGLNFAPVGDSYAHHTDRDRPARVQPFTVRHALANTVGIVRRIDSAGPGTATEPATFFDAGLRGLTYGARAGGIVAWTACGLGAIVWLVLTRRLARGERGVFGVLIAAAWSLAGMTAGAVAMVAVAWALRASRAELNPWYAAPHWLVGCTLAIGLLTFVLVSRLAPRTPARLAPTRTPASVWWLALPLWIGVAALLQVTAPSASYLVALPLLAASAAIAAAGTRAMRLRVASAIVLVVSAHFWVPDAIRLLSFLPALLAWFAIVPPPWLFAALMIAALAMCGPPVAAMAAGLRPPPRALVVVAALMAIGFAALAWRAPAYTSERPQRRTLRYVHDAVRGQAWWEQGGPEPQIALTPDAPAGGRWDAVTGAPDTALPVASVPGVFRFRTPVPPLPVPAPASVQASAGAAVDGRVAFTVRVVPREHLWATVALPPGVIPYSSSIPGRVSGGRWRATYVAPPQDGVDIRVVVRASDAAALAGTIAVLSTYSVPESVPGGRVPSWVPVDALTWHPRALYVLPAAPDGRSTGPSSTP
jgi:hypothetical protein